MAMISPVWSERRPGPTARTSPCWGFSLAVSGMTRPDAVVSSDSLGRTTMRSSSGCRFMGVGPPVSTLDWRVLTIAGPDPLLKRDGASGDGQLEVGVGAGVEGRGTVGLEPPPGGG